jgi:hypothetical protein
VYVVRTLLPVLLAASVAAASDAAPAEPRDGKPFAGAELSVTYRDAVAAMAQTPRMPDLAAQRCRHEETRFSGWEMERRGAPVPAGPAIRLNGCKRKEPNTNSTG